MKILSLLGVVLLASQAQAKTSGSIEVLTYSSMQGKGSLGAYLEQHFKEECAECQVHFSNTHENAGLLAKLRTSKKRGLSHQSDVVLGMNETEYRQALSEDLIEAGFAFDESPFAIIVDTQKLKPADWPKSWKELNAKLSSSILVEDPRTSSVGAGWLLSHFALNLIDAKNAKAVTKRYYPSWTAAYDAFLKGDGVAVWSFASSEAYHRCNEKTDEARNRYRAMPLAEGYPMQREYVAVVKLPVKSPSDSSKSEISKKFVNYLVSDKIQSEIPKLNWMFPASSHVRLDKCFSETTRVKSVELDKNLDLKKLMAQWMDQWSLQN